MSLSLRPAPAPPALEPTAAAPAAFGRDATSEPPPRRIAAWGAVRRHLWLVLGAGALAATGAAVAERFVNPVYESVASVRVQPKDAHLPGVYQPAVTGVEVGNELDLLHSRTLAEDVVDALALRVRVLAPRPARAGLLGPVRASRSADTGTFTFERGRDGFVVTTGRPSRRVAVATPGRAVELAGTTLVLAPAAAAEPRVTVRVDGFDAAVAALGEAMTVERAGRESQVITVRYRSSDPALARDVPNAAVGGFLAMRRRGQQLETSGTADALREQVRTVGAELAQADATLRAFRERQRVVNPHEEGTTEIARLAQLRTERLQVGSERDALTAVMHTLGERTRNPDAGELPFRQLGGFPTLTRNEAFSSYVRALTAVEDQRAALLMRRTPEDPEVLVLTDRARALEGQLRATATTYLDGLTRQTADIDAELARSEAQLSRLPGQEAEYARLERGPKVLGEMLTLLQTRLKEAEVAEAITDPSVQRLDVAPLPSRPLRPRPAHDIPLAACAGLLVGLAGVFARERLDRTVRTRDDVRRWTGLPVIGVIPHAPPGAGPGWRESTPRPTARARALLPGAGARRVRETSGLMLAEAFARLHATVAVSRPGGELLTIVVTSPLSGEGKTTTAGYFAAAVARAGSRTLLVDADLRRGTLHTRFGLPRAPGLAEVLAGEATLEDVTHAVDVGDGATLAVVCAGGAADPARRLLTAARAREVLASAAARFDSVIVDASPINVTADAAVLASEADGVLLVARAGQTSLDALAYAAQQLGQARTTLLGVVMNDIDPVRDAAYDAEYRFYHDPYFQPSGAA
ncbi:hypothetical protein tb265_25760 [Gemmatimonadetes bacterium T265]|nr:hypothetical protein tb265_25760 [Gemmatimonadetes bacterium T265]